MNDMNEGAGLVNGPVDVEAIKTMIPHRYPFLLVDRVLDWQDDPRKITCIKNVTYNEPFFQGHFPNNPVMPGVMIVEAMAQCAGILGALLADGAMGGNLYYLAKVDNARFSRTVVPGDQLVMTVHETSRKRGMGFFDCMAEVDGRKAASCQIVCAGKK